jgi:hypothetical protein
LNAIQALYQLSYTPTAIKFLHCIIRLIVCQLFLLQQACLLT